VLAVDPVLVIQHGLDCDGLFALRIDGQAGDPDRAHDDPEE
jgi:hypothetical protein